MGNWGKNCGPHAGKSGERTLNASLQPSLREWYTHGPAPARKVRAKKCWPPKIRGRPRCVQVAVLGLGSEVRGPLAGGGALAGQHHHNSRLAAWAWMRTNASGTCVGGAGANRRKEGYAPSPKMPAGGRLRARCAHAVSPDLFRARVFVGQIRGG